MEIRKIAADTSELSGASAEYQRLLSDIKRRWQRTIDLVKRNHQPKAGDAEEMLLENRPLMEECLTALEWYGDMLGKAADDYSDCEEEIYEIFDA